MLVDGEVCQVEPRFFDQMRQAMQAAHAERHSSEPSTAVTRFANGIALLSVDGPLVRWETGSTASYPVLQQDLQRLDADESVSAVVMVVDSPGGQAMQCPETCAALDAFSKPVVAYAEGYMASAAYCLGCHCDAIYATESAYVGSIGTKMGLFDLSKAFEMAGIEAVAVDTGGVKSMGFPGLPVTDEQKEYLQELVQKSHARFRQSVLKRPLTESQVDALSTGRVWHANEAVQLKLIDGVKTLSEVIALVQSQVSGGAGRRSAVMEGGELMTDPTSTAPAADQNAAAGGETKTQPAAAAPTAPAPAPEPAADQAATLEQLKAACPDASAEFVLQQLEAGATTAQAQQNYIADLQKQLAERPAESSVESPGQGLQATAGAGGGGGGADPVASFERLVQEEAQECGDRMQALQSCAESNPTLYAQYRQALASQSDGQARRRRRRQVGRVVQTGAASTEAAAVEV